MANHFVAHLSAGPTVPFLLLSFGRFFWEGYLFGTFRREAGAFKATIRSD